MSHTSPASMLVWALMCFFMEAFLLFHLWSFDRFKCLKWNNGPSSGAFKRVMTYSYLLTIPLLATYGVGNAIIKYHEGFINLPPYGIIPKPYQLWGSFAKSTLFPLQLTLSIGWSFEMVTHLEEFCFWLFLVNAGSQQDWFHSSYFKTWVVGSLIAVTYMPLVTILTRSDPLKAEGYTFLAGGLGSLSVTLLFIPILWRFPGFLRNLKAEGVDSGTMIRLTKFSELNIIRVFFRLMFTVSILILGVDGTTPHHHVNESMFWTDILIFLTSIGCTISSAITLVIFFPRSIEGEIAARDASRERKRLRYSGRTASIIESHTFTRSDMTQSRNTYRENPSGTYLLTSSPIQKTVPLGGYDNEVTTAEIRQIPRSYSSQDKFWSDEERDIPSSLPNLPPLRPNRKRDRDIELGGIGIIPTENNLLKYGPRVSNVNHMVYNFKSPIDLLYEDDDHDLDSKGSWLTFNRPV